MPSNKDEARAYATEWARFLGSRDYTADRADKEVLWGYSGPQDAGYEISHGKISIPDCHTHGDGRYPRWVFSFRQLAESAGQPEQALLL